MMQARTCQTLNLVTPVPSEWQSDFREIKVASHTTIQHSHRAELSQLYDLKNLMENLEKSNDCNYTDVFKINMQKSGEFKSK